MIEIRNDLIASSRDVEAWVQGLGDTLAVAARSLGYALPAPRRTGS